jgi:hypothetical protein
LGPQQLFRLVGVGLSNFQADNAQTDRDTRSSLFTEEEAQLMLDADLNRLGE